MTLRRLLNVAYAALSQGRDEDGLKELNEELEVQPGVEPRRRAKGDFAALIAATKMKQRAG